MKTLLLLGLSLITPFLLLAQSNDIEMGQSREDTLKILGKPIGTIELHEKTLLLYPQGEVTLKKGKVSNIDLMSEEEFQADQQRLKQEREEWEIDQARLAERRIEEGEKVKAYKMKSSAFAALPAKDRVDYWRSYQIRYPEIDVSEEIARSLEGYETELTELRAQQRIAELEARVALAEKNAATARLEAEKARDEAETRSRNTTYGLRYYTDPRVNRNYYYRPPTVTIYTDGKGTTTTHKRHYHKDKPTFDYTNTESEQSKPQTRFPAAN